MVAARRRIPRTVTPPVEPKAGNTPRNLELTRCVRVARQDAGTLPATEHRFPQIAPGGRHAETLHGRRGREYVGVDQRACADVHIPEPRVAAPIFPAGGNDARAFSPERLAKHLAGRFID